MRKHITQVVLLLLAVAAVFAGGCGKKSPTEGKTPLARVYDKYFFLEDLAENQTDLSKDDSAALVKNLIELWMQKQLMLNKAEMNLSDEDKDIDKIVEDYRASLLIDKYKREFLKEKLDTNISESEIQKYYNQYSESFVNNKVIVKAHFVKIPVVSDNVPLFRQQFSANKAADTVQIREYIRRNGLISNDYTKKWITFTEIAGMLPSPITNIEPILKSTNFIQNQDEEAFYFVRFDEYKLAGEIKPLELVSEDIRLLLINKRKTELLKTLEINIYQNAVESGNIEIFDSTYTDK